MGNFDCITLAPPDVESLIYAIDGSIKVRHRSQFFRWTQGGLQRLIPHETLICAWGDIDGMCFRYEVFTSVVLDERFTAGLADPLDGLLSRFIDIWRRNGKRIAVHRAGQDGDGLDARLRAELDQNGIGRIVVHGACDGAAGSFFAFINGAETFGKHDAYLMELILPHLHLAVHRLEAEASQQPAREIVIDAIISGREAQVLQWVRAGKTNREIAQILEISPLTVKNHVQKILRKLNVSNRAQAVAKGIAARLIADRENV